MTRLSERERIGRSFSVVLASCCAALIVVGAVASLAGCGLPEQLEGRTRNRKGNRLFHDTQFIDAIAEYQKALTQVDDPRIHYNLGQAYSKVVRAGSEVPVLLGLEGEFVCQQIPGVKVVTVSSTSNPGPDKPIQAGACVKENDRHYAECGRAKTAPVEKEIAELNDKMKSETDDAKKKDLKSQITEKQQELMRYTCTGGAQCVEGRFCSLTSPEIADLAAQHFQIWIKAQPSDDEIKKQLVVASRHLQEAKETSNQSAVSEAEQRVNDLQAKDQTRKQMTLLWTDSNQFKLAIDYWTGLLNEKPNDPEIMGTLAGIELKAGNWRKSVEWYNKVAQTVSDTSSKVATYQYIGNLAWSKLNSRLLIGNDAIELADRGIGALQRASEIDPKNPRPVGIAASLFNFRSTAHGASFAAAIDRTSQKDLSERAHVLLEEAKKAQGQATGSPPTPAPGSTSSAPGSGSGGSGTGSGGASGSGASAASAAATGSNARAGNATSSAAPAAPAPSANNGRGAPAPPPTAGAAAPSTPPAAPAAPPSDKPPAETPAAAPEKPPAEPTPPAPSSGGSAEKSGG